MVPPGERRDSQWPDETLRLIAMSLSLGLFLVFIRANLVNFSYLHSAFFAAPRVALAGYYDLAYVAVIAAVFSRVPLDRQAKRDCAANP